MASFGETLRRERELRGVELREVADATKISIRFLQALENDRVDVLPGGIFPRAFVRQYANYLGLDPDRMVAEFVYAYGDAAAAAAAAAPAPSRRPGSARGVAIVLLLLAAIAAAVAWFLAKRRADEQASEPVAVASVPSSTFPPDPLLPPPTTLSSVAVSTQGLMLALQSRQNCWVAVQADGVKVMDRVMNEGETQSFTARNEIVLSVGNAGGISFSVNGQPGIALGREGEVRRNIVITRQSLPSLVQGAAPAGGMPPGAAPASPRSG
jgi:cytoskeletal protein RodZ